MRLIEALDQKNAKNIVHTILVIELVETLALSFSCF
jgi:hypothetical protein